MVGLADRIAGLGSEYDVASMSRVTKKKLAGYEDIPDWTTDPTDGSLRDSEVCPTITKWIRSC
jgi:hypothetical protein